MLTGHEELSLRRTVAPELRFNPERPAQGRVVLNGAKVVTLIDVSTSWPGPGGLAMGGFVYENLVPYGHFPLSRRLEWVAAATPEYVPEPYERLAAVLRSSGEDADAREVLLAKQRQPARDAAARREALGLRPGLDGGVRLPAGPGRGLDGAAVGGGHGGVLAVRTGFAQGQRASRVEPRAVRAGSAGAGDRPRPGRLLADGGRLAVDRGGPRHARMDTGHHRRGRLPHGCCAAADRGGRPAGRHPGRAPCADGPDGVRTDAPRRRTHHRSFPSGTTGTGQIPRFPLLFLGSGQGNPSTRHQSFTAPLWRPPRPALFNGLHHAFPPRSVPYRARDPAHPGAVRRVARGPCGDARRPRRAALARAGGRRPRGVRSRRRSCWRRPGTPPSGRAGTAI